MVFRRDINGLRAIAVIAVMLFHFNAVWAPGGFAGVDVFFVISGFLMTSIIFNGIEGENFSLLRFYIARANRIIPALAVLCLAVLVFGWFYLKPSDYQMLSTHAISSIGFFSNIVYWQELGYFDTAVKQKWLLHTWSLSVEWQFYIIYPIILLFACKFFSKNTAKLIVLLCTVISFIACIIITYNWYNPAYNPSYYLLPTRVWELTFGGLVYLYPLKLKDTHKKTLEWLGLLLIICSYAFISKDSPWPGYLAFFPVLGAFFLLQSNRQDSFLTGNIVFQKLGAWSYSIYLWHWPLVVGIYYFSLPDYSNYVGIALSILLGFLSYTYIEQFKFKRQLNSIASIFSYKPLYLLLAVVLFSSAVFMSHGAKSRFSDLQFEDTLVMPSRDNGYCFYSADGDINFKVDATKCILGDTSKEVNTLLFGDSYAGHSEPFFDVVFKEHGMAMHSMSTNWCIPSNKETFLGNKESPAYDQCILNRRYLDNNMQNYKNIIFAGVWDYTNFRGFLGEVKDIIKKSAELKIDVFIVAGAYRYQKNPLVDFYRYAYFGQSWDINNDPGNDDVMVSTNAELKAFSDQYDNVHFISRDMLYHSSKMFEAEGLSVPYTLDGAHISVLGSIKSAEYFINHPEHDDIMQKF